MESYAEQWHSWTCVFTGSLQWLYWEEIQEHMMQEQWEGACGGLGDKGGSSYQAGNTESGQKWLDSGDNFEE